MNEKIGIGIVTYNRLSVLKETIDKVLQYTKTKKYALLVADDGSTDGTIDYLKEKKIAFITGENKGVCTNKNRILYHLKDYDFIYIIEDDIFPIKDNWENLYIDAIKESKIQYFSRTLTSWDQPNKRHKTELLKDPPIQNGKFTYLESTGCPGQLYIITKEILQKVGGLSLEFKGYGYGHGDWTYRIKKMGFTGKKYIYRQIDVLEARNAFKTLNTETVTEEKKKEEELKKNLKIKYHRKNLYHKTNNFYCGDYLRITDKIQNSEYIIQNLF